MKFTKDSLQQIIKEELKEAFQATEFDDTTPADFSKEIENLSQLFIDELLIGSGLEGPEALLSLLANTIVSNYPDSKYLQDEVLRVINITADELKARLEILIKEYDVRDIEDLYEDQT